jgi:aldose 1-epimerase
VRITHGTQTAEIDLYGGRLTSYVVAGQEVVAAEPDSPDAIYRSSLLAPWPNRVAEGRWTWEGEELVLPVNEDPPGTAIHGLVAFETFQVVASDGSSVRVSHDLPPSPGYPFPLRVEASYALGDDGLSCTLEAVATGDRPTPVALGVHPYLRTRGPVDDVVLTIPASRVVEGDERWEETARPPVAGPDDLRGGRSIGTREIDGCWTELDGDGRVSCSVRFPDGDEVEVWGGGTTRYVVVFTSHTLPGDLRRTSIAVEPNTAPANALRSGTDLDVLAPGERLVLDWGLRPSWLWGSALDGEAEQG